MIQKTLKTFMQKLRGGEKAYSIVYHHNTAVTILSRIVSESEQDNIRHSFQIESYTEFKG